MTKEEKAPRTMHGKLVKIWATITVWMSKEIDKLHEETGLPRTEIIRIALNMSLKEIEKRRAKGEMPLEW